MIIYLGEESSQHEFLKFLEVLFTNQLTLDEKKTILENDYQIKVNENMQKEMKAMCNLADRIEEKALEKGIKQGIEQGKDVKKLQELIQKLEELVEEENKVKNEIEEKLQTNTIDRENNVLMVNELE